MGDSDTTFFQGRSLLTHYEGCWRHEGHHACAVTRVEQLWVKVEQLCHELHDVQVRRDEWEKMYNQAIDRDDEVQELWLSPCEAEGLRRQLARAQMQSATPKKAVEWLWGFYDGNTLVAKPGYEDDIREAWDKLLTAVDSITGDALLDRLAEAEGLRRQLAQAVVARADAELAAHVHDKSCGELAQTVYTERQLRREAEKHRADARLAQHVLELKVGLERQSAYTERALRQEAEQRAEALAALVNEETAALLERLADYARRAAKAAKGSPDDVDEAYNDEEITRELATRIREALEETE